MEYHRDSYRFSEPAAAGYFPHHYNAVFIRIRRGHVGVVPVAAMVDGNWILDDAATIRQTRTRLEPSGFSTTTATLGRGILQDDTWVLDSHQEAASNNTKHRVSNFLETRTSEINKKEEEEICVVCQQDLGTNRISTLDCHHRYHVHCIKTWLTLKNFCPICKAAALSTVQY